MGPNANETFSEVELNFDNVTVNGQPAKIPTDFHGQGFTITNRPSPSDKAYNSNIATIIFDATLELGKGKLLSSSSPHHDTPITGNPQIDQKNLAETAKSLGWSAYIIGIKGSSSVSDLGDALISGIKEAQQPWGTEFKNVEMWEEYWADDTAITLPKGAGMSVVT